MARKTNETINKERKNPPKNLDGHIFYGLTLDREQTLFRDAIYDRLCDIVFCNAKAGTGKSLISVATAILMVEYGMYDELVYVTAGGVHEYKQGLLPGTLEDKSKYLMQPLYQAVVRLGYDPEQVIRSESNLWSQKMGSAFISCMTDSYARGTNIGTTDHKVICILDEAQNMTLGVLKTLLTRIGEGSKVIVIGHDRQCDLKYPQNSGFVRYMEHFRPTEKCRVCTLTKNHRSWVADWADDLSYFQTQG